MDNLDTFITKYIEVAKDEAEIEDVIWKDEPGGMKKTEGRGVLPRRVRDALKLEFKQVRFETY